jgi:hypothetical protein
MGKLRGNAPVLALCETPYRRRIRPGDAVERLPRRGVSIARVQSIGAAQLVVSDDPPRFRRAGKPACSPAGAFLQAGRYLNPERRALTSEAVTA